MRFVFDEQALGELYRREGSRLLVFFVRRTYDAQLSLDLVGETFARAFERRERFRGSSEAEALSWVWSIARTTLADSLRRGRAERRAIARLGVDVPRLSGEEVADVERRAGLDDLRVLVEEALAGLSREHREALRLRVVMELDYAAVAARLGISQATARASVSGSACASRLTRHRGLTRMSAARTTDELLGELGDSLERAWRDPQPSWRRRPLRRGARVGLVLAIGVVLIGSTAAATLPQWAASPPAPGVAPSGAYAARGTSSGISWGLVVSACRRPMGSYSVVLQTADGSTGTACVPAPGARAVFYDVRAGVALAFGGLPPATARVVVSDGTRTLTTAAVTPGVAASRSGARFFVVALPGASSVRSLSGYTASGAVTEACRGVGCEAP